MSASYLAPAATGPGRQGITQLRFSPDSSKLAVLRGTLDVDVWDLEREASVVLLEGAGSRIRFAPDGESLAVLNHHLSQWALPDGSFKNVTRQHFGWVSHIAIVPNQQRVLIGTGGGIVYHRDLEDGRLLQSLDADGGTGSYRYNPAIEAMQLSPGGDRLAVVSTNALKIWDLESFDVVDINPSLIGLYGTDFVAWSGDETIISVGDVEWGSRFYALEPTVEMVPDTRIYNSDNPYVPGNPMLLEIPGTPCGAGHANDRFTLSPTDPFLLVCFSSSDDDGEGNPIWDTLSNIDHYLEGEFAFRVLDFSADGQHLIGFGNEGSRGPRSKKVWLTHFEKQAGAFELVSQIELNDEIDWLETAAISPDNRLVALLDDNHGVYFFDLLDGTNVGKIELALQPLSLAFSSDGRLLAIGSSSGTVHLIGIE